MKKIWKLFSAIAVILFMTSCTETLVSTFGSIGGTVQDASGKFLSGVTVTINPLGYSQVTNADGAFQYDNLEVSEYTLVYSKMGYETYKHKVTVKPGIVSSVQITMKPEGTSLSFDPEILDFGSKKTEEQLKISNWSGKGVSYRLSSSNSWISLSKTSGTVSTEDYVTILVSRGGLSPADYNGSVSVKLDDSEYTIPVRMSVEAAGMPDVTMEGVSEVTSNSALVSGIIRNLGSSTVTQHGFCWSDTNPFPELSDSFNQFGDASGVKSFSTKITGLDHSTKYYVRAYAANSYGTAYSSVQTFTTVPLSGNQGGNADSGELVVPQGLVSYYAFDNEDASDLSENELTGTLVNSPSFTKDTPSGTGMAIHLSGVKGSYISIPYNVFKSLLKFSVSFWIKDFSQGLVFTSNDSNDDQGYYTPRLRVTDSQQFEFYTNYNYYWENHDFKFVYDSTPIMSSSWHHVVVTSDEGMNVLYIDGLKKDAVEKPCKSSKGTKVYVGGDADGLFSSITMKMDNLRFYQRSLSEQEVKLIYNAEK